VPILRGFLAFFALFFSIVFFYFLLDTKNSVGLGVGLQGGALRHPPLCSMFNVQVFSEKQEKYRKLGRFF